MNLIQFKDKKGEVVILNPSSIAYVIPINNIQVNGSQVFFAADLTNPVVFEVSFTELASLLVR
jgi:hypothetical protein